MSRRKKARIFRSEFKVKAVERMLAGENASALAGELKVLRKSLYEWKDIYISRGPSALRTVGRPRREEMPGLPPDAVSDRAELLQARQRIAELERKVGHQLLEIDFFAEALRRVDAALKEESGRSVERSIRSLGSKHRKAD
jgi:transposase